MTTTDPLSSPYLRPTWVLLREEARVRGFRNALAFKRWCVRHAVVIRRDTKMLWVRPVDVDRVVDELDRGAAPSDSAGRSADDPVASAVAALMLRGRSR